MFFLLGAFDAEQDLEKRVAHEKRQLEHATRGGNGSESSAAYTPATQHFQVRGELQGCLLVGYTSHFTVYTLHFTEYTP